MSVAAKKELRSKSQFMEARIGQGQYSKISAISEGETELFLGQSWTMRGHIDSEPTGFITMLALGI
jgi:hypothetical protein